MKNCGLLCAMLLTIGASVFAAPTLTLTVTPAEAGLLYVGSAMGSATALTSSCLKVSPVCTFTAHPNPQKDLTSRVFRQGNLTLGRVYAQYNPAVSASPAPVGFTLSFSQDVQKNCRCVSDSGACATTNYYFNIGPGGRQDWNIHLNCAQ